MQLEHLDYLSPLGRHYRLTLAVPLGSAPESGWPLACVLDQTQFQAVLAAVPGAAPLCGAVLGVGYVQENWREQDYTPGPEGEAGRADDFRVLLRDVFLPWAHGRAQLDPQRRLLCGHSLAGLFALHALVHEPGLFQAMAVSSPSVWWGDAYLARLLAQPLPPAALTVPVSITVGEYEQRLGPAEESLPEPAREQRRQRLLERRMVDGARELAQELAQHQGGEPRFRMIPGCNHSQSGWVALPQGCLEWLADVWPR